MSIRLEGYTQTTQQNAPLKRTMKTRHLIMLSLGGVIGTGLFFNTGYIISTTGAAGTLLAYLIGALVVWLVMQCLGELSVAMPETGAFHVYAARYLGPAPGYIVGWLCCIGIYRCLALLADLDCSAGFEFYRRRILYAVLVSTGAGLGLVCGVLRDYFWPERHLHALFCRRGVLVLAGKSGHYHRLYHPRRGGDFWFYPDAVWLARAWTE